MDARPHRYAVYVAPDRQCPLGRFGNAWLGRDPETGRPLPRPTLSGYTADAIAALTTTPARYGFHGTLKPPFRLAPDASEADLATAVAALAATLPPVTVKGFAVRTLGRFVALVPDPSAPAIDRLARTCVHALDRFRAPQNPADVSRYRTAGLTPTQARLLRRWGYPYVLSEFRFHLTLSNALDDAERNRLRDGIAAHAADALGPATFADIALFAEPEAGAPFRLLRRFPLSGTRAPRGASEPSP